MAKNAAAQTVEAAQTVQVEELIPEVEPIEIPVLDPDLMGDGHNVLRKVVLPFMNIINKEPSGLFIPEDQLEAAGWKLTVTDDMLVMKKPGNKTAIKGLFLPHVKFVILAYSEEYIRYKSVADEVELRGQRIGLYEDFKASLDKKQMEVCGEYVIVLLDERNQPLHDVPFIVRFRNVSLWSFKEALRKIYAGYEKSFAALYQQLYSAKSDQWRALAPVDIEFHAVEEGQDGKTNECCKPKSFVVPTPQTFGKLYLGTTEDKQLYWGLRQETIATTMQLPAATTANQPINLSDAVPTEADANEAIEVAAVTVQ